MSDDRLYFRQLLAGRDFAKTDPTARDMRNFVYLIGDRQSGECVAVDPAWNVRDLIAIAAKDGMKITGALATHYHPDHVGGDLLGMAEVEGIVELLEVAPLKIHCQKDEAEWIRRATGVSAADLAIHASGDEVVIGEQKIRLIHTPGHTPGSQCFLVGEKLIAGDTLFLEGCGRTDFPGGDSDELYKSLNQRLAHLPDTTVLYPGHLYSPEGSAGLGDVRKTNYVFRMKSIEDWRRFMG